MKIVIIDYQMSNMFSVKNALDKIKIQNFISSNPEELYEADGAILPGVGSFPEAMFQLNKLNLTNAITNFVKSKKPFMGICLGMHLLFSESFELTKTKGLNIIEGIVKKIENDENNIKIPHVGWNKVFLNINNNASLNNRKIFEDNFYYFVHSYYVDPKDNNIINSTTKYGGIKFCSSILKDNIFACQFHPEKSGQLGIEIFKNFFLNN